jgi:hypothetical protein
MSVSQGLGMDRGHQEYGSDADRRASGVVDDGESITCEENNG